MKSILSTLSLLALLAPGLVTAWPIDGYPDTGIRRLEEQLDRSGVRRLRF